MRRYLGTRELAKLSERGRYAVGQNLYLQISETNTRSWLFRYRLRGRERHMGLGPIDLVTLAEARDKVHELRRQVLAGVDPLEAKRDAERARILAEAKQKTFKETALAYIAAHEAGWKGDKSRQQWTLSLEKYAYPKIGSLTVQQIDVPAVLSVVEPIWTKVPETARRIRNRIELVLDYGTAKGLRTGDNPARWNGLLDNLLPRVNGGKTHYAALPYREIGAFMAELRKVQAKHDARTVAGVSARALELLILTATRSNEAAGARWSEIDGNVWTIPPERMKKGEREHRVPLSKQALKVLASMPRTSDVVFPGPSGEPLQPRRLAFLLNEVMKRRDITIHGLRSTFRDWAAERTRYPVHIAELALAHSVGNAVERAYRRSDLLKQRARLMQDWANFCDRPSVSGKADVTPIRKREVRA